MKIYKYYAVNNSGKHINGIEKEENVGRLKEQLRKNGYFIFKMKKVIKPIAINWLKKLSLRELSLFSTHLNSLIEAGFNISDALEIFNTKNYNKTIKNNMQKVKKDIEGGRSFYESLSKYKKLYPMFYLEMINVGEQSGNMDTILKSLASYYMKEYTMKKKIISSMIYPVIILITAIVTFLYIETSIVPSLIASFKGIEDEMPMYSIVLMKVSKLIVSNMFLVIIISTICYILLLKSLKVSIVKRRLDTMKNKLPLISNIYKKVISARFARCLAILQQSGINLINSVEMINKVMDNEYIKTEMHKVLISVEKGNSMAEALERVKILPEFITSMMFLGEQSGNLEEMMNLSADIYDREVEETMEKLVSYIEPALIILLGVVIGALILSIMVPMLKMMQEI